MKIVAGISFGKAENPEKKQILMSITDSMVMTSRSELGTSLVNYPLHYMKYRVIYLYHVLEGASTTITRTKNNHGTLEWISYN